ncbi:MAG: MFS transporter [Clostridiales Family XIII bacterium]|nr:MFS transporter [Clostridiales Family XIII bacterium]
MIVFGLLYSTVYLARFGFNELLPLIAADYGISGPIQSLLSSSVYIGYSAGCLLNGLLIDRYSATRFIVIGSVGSVAANLLLYTTPPWTVLLALSLFNGYIQSMVWIGGISILVKWFRKSDRGLPVGFINMCSAFAYLIMLYLPARLLPTDGAWSESHGYSLFIICYVSVVFMAFIREDPKELGTRDYVETDDESAEGERVLAHLPFRYVTVFSALMRDRSLLFWMGIAFLSSFCRYGLLTLLPVYYTEGAKIALSPESTNFILSAGMGAGTLVVCILVGRWFYRNMGLGVVACSGLSAALVVLFPSMTGKEMIGAGIFMVGFLLFGINGILWLHAMSAGGRRFAGTVTGLLNGAAYFGALLQSLFLPFIIKSTNDWLFVFLSMEIVCILMVVCALFVCKRDTNIRES